MDGQVHAPAALSIKKKALSTRRIGGSVGPSGRQNQAGKKTIRFLSANRRCSLMFKQGSVTCI